MCFLNLPKKMENPFSYEICLFSVEWLVCAISQKPPNTPWLFKWNHHFFLLRVHMLFLLFSQIKQPFLSISWHSSEGVKALKWGSGYGDWILVVWNSFLIWPVCWALGEVVLRCSPGHLDNVPLMMNTTALWKEPVPIPCLFIFFLSSLNLLKHSQKRFCLCGKGWSLQSSCTSGQKGPQLLKSIWAGSLSHGMFLSGMSE